MSAASPREAIVGLLKGGVTVVRGAGVMGRMHAELALRFRPRVLIVADYRSERLDRTTQSIADKARRAGCRLLCVSPDDLETTLREVAGVKGADDFILKPFGVREVLARIRAVPRRSMARPRHAATRTPFSMGGTGAGLYSSGSAAASPATCRPR